MTVDRIWDRSGLLLAFAVVCAGACNRTGNSTDYAELSSIRSVGLAYLEEDRPTDAAEQFALLASRAPDEPLGPANLAVARLRLGEVDLALEASEEAVRRAPSNPDVLLVRAAVLTGEGRDDDAITALRTALESDSLHAGSLWALSRADSLVAAPLLERIVARWSGNLPARMDLAERYAAAGDLDRLVGHLEFTRQLLPRGEEDAKDELAKALRSARSGDAALALSRTRTLHNLMRIDPTYGSGLRRLSAGQAPLGTPMERFAHIRATPEEASQVWRQVQFVEAQSVTGTANPVLTDFDGDGDQDIVAAEDSGVLVCFSNDAGSLVRMEACTKSGSQVRGSPILAADFDGDARGDLVVVGDGISMLPSADIMFDDPVDLDPNGELVWSGLAVDADHDGDLDLLVGREGSSRLYQQQAPGRFSDVGDASGVAALSGVRAWSMGDLEGDGDIDLVAVTGDAVRLLMNQRHGRYEAGVPIQGIDAPTSALISDVDADGLFDIVAVGSSGLAVSLNLGDGVFASFRSAIEAATARRGETISALDYDNDGIGDVLLAGRDAAALARGVGDGRFELTPQALPWESMDAVRVTDLDGDGDQDLVAVAQGTLGVLRNDGGNANHHLKVRLLSLADGSGKVNRLGLGSRLDLSAGDLQVARIVSGESEHFGLGDRSAADVVRIEWTNGVPQNVVRPEVNSVLVETQTLKGSCGFLYVWTGNGFKFVTDMMWKSALGMPLGIMAGETFYAPPEPSLEYVRIPPGMLQPRDGFYETRITEELWEVGYLDELALIAVEHPMGTEVYVDEAFAKPDRPNSHLYVVGEKRRPEAALTGEGVEVSDLLARRDFQFVGGFDAGPFQGTTELHDLVLTLSAAAGEPSRLFLSGWLFPTDASINVTIGQSGEAVVIPPYLEVPDGAGNWRPLNAHIAFPTGKNKTVVVDLPEGVPESDPRLRIRTSMEIYWDEAFYHTVSEAPRFAPVPRRLDPVEAELDIRGFSRVFRRGGRYGPHWFDYDEVVPESPWRPLPGAYTALGDVLPLLLSADDQYVVFGAGDEIAIRFEALDLPGQGMSRTFFLYSDAFLKDADLNTLGGQTVEPLPLHGQEDYPTGMPQPDAGHRDFVAQYQTRIVE